MWRGGDRRARGFAVVLLVMLWFRVGETLADPRPTLYVSFDRGFDGQGPGGVVKATVVGLSPTLAAGKVGQALKIGPLSGHLDYPTAGILNAREGSIEMWVKPVDWRSTDGWFHVFFDARGQGALYLYKYYQNAELLMLSTADQAHGPYFSSAAAVDWAPGKWHFIAGTWSSRGVMLYVDGVPTTRRPVPCQLPKSLGSSFSLGDLAWDRPRFTTTLLDEVRLYDVALTPAQVARHFAGVYEPPATGARAFALHYDVDDAHQALDLEIADEATGRRRGIAARLALVRHGAPLPAGAALRPFAGSLMRVRVPWPAAGTYDIVAWVYDRGRLVATLRRTLTVPALRWPDEEALLDRRIPRPWTAPSVVRGAVRVWGRTYRFGPSALPTQIVSLGRPLLASPVSLQATLDGRPALARAGAVRIVREGNRVRATQTLSYSGGPSAVRIDVSTTIAFDGLARIELSAAGAEKGLGQLVLNIPLAAAHASLRSKWNARGYADSGRIPVGAGVVDQSRFIPFYWIGDNEVGLFWFAETGAQWPNADRANALQVVRRPGVVTLRLNLKSPAQPLPSPWHFTIGLEATPVKPLPSGWRTLRIAPARGANVTILWPTPTPDSMKYYGYPEASDPARFRARLARLRAAGLDPVPYVCPTFLSTGSPQWPFFKRAWFMNNVQSAPADVRAYGDSFALMSPRAAGWRRFIEWKTAAFVKTFGLRGLYFDNTMPWGGFAPHAGVGYLRDGREEDEYPMFAYRRLYRTLDEILQANGPGSVSIAHASGNPAIPMLAFVDAYVDGEQYRGIVKDDYLDVMSLAAFRAEFMGRQWGLIPVFLPEFDAREAARRQPTRALMALLMLHDVAPWPLHCNVAEVNRALADLDAFGYAGASFYPYFAQTPPATTGARDVYVSAYRRKDGAWLLVAGNLSRQPWRGRLCIDGRVVGAVGRLVTWPHRRPLPGVASGPAYCADTSVRALDYRFFEIPATAGSRPLGPPRP
ncbi:MAG: hypothetical protein M0037_14115 [Betaproteobacteria bacterium]|nr:hypothetical protein [Betaproteobacteria bacterium]